MSWTEIRATAAQAGQKFVVAQPAFVLGLYGDVGLNAHGEAVLEWWMGLLPEGASLYFLGSKAHDFREVDPRALKRIRTTLRDLAKKSQFYMFKNAPGFAVGTHSLELAMGIEPDDDGAVNMAYAVLPLSYPEAAGPDAVVEMFRKLVDRIPFRHATAGYGFDLVWGREWEQVALPVIMAAGRRYLALDVRDRQVEPYLVDKVKSRLADLPAQRHPEEARGLRTHGRDPHRPGRAGPLRKRHHLAGRGTSPGRGLKPACPGPGAAPRGQPLHRADPGRDVGLHEPVPHQSGGRRRLVREAG